MGISTHVLDTERGRPAAGVPVTLSVEEGGSWRKLFATATDADGRCKQLLPESVPLETASYRIHFATAVYYSAQQVQGLYPFMDVTFTVTNAAQHYHIPLLLTGNSYMTYRGS